MTAWRRFLVGVGALIVAAGCARHPEDSLGVRQEIAPGVELYRSADHSLVDGVGPIAISLLKLDPERVRLTSALSNDRVVDAETVDGIAQRLGAVAAVNGGFFNRENGEPIGLLKVGGELVSDTGATKGAVIFHNSPSGPTELTFDQLGAKVAMSFKSGGHERRVPIDGVDTTRARGRLMLYTPAYHDDTDTAPTGTEWVLDGDPLRVIDVRMNFGHTRIPRKGAVLSFGGTDLPENLAGLVEGVHVTFGTSWNSAHGLPAQELDAASDIVNGAGLLRRAGQILTDWRVEALSRDAFVNMRHPRTLIGVDDKGFIWLAAIDGRQPSYSLGMTFAELQRLCDRLNLTSALNLDGGGSTTMVVKGQVVNRPSDPAGKRPVSDAIVVTLR